MFAQQVRNRMAESGGSRAPKASVPGALHRQMGSRRRGVEVTTAYAPEEQEAVRLGNLVASGGTAPVISRSSNPAISRMCACDTPGCTKCEHGSFEPPAEQRVHRAARDGSAPFDLDGTELIPSGGRALDPERRAYFESRFGADLGDVRIHTGPAAARAADRLSARAYTVGRDIIFGAGELESQGSKQLLAHELVHVLQQSSRVAPRSTLGVTSEGHASEREADVLAHAATSPGMSPVGKPAQHLGPMIARQGHGHRPSPAPSFRVPTGRWILVELPGHMRLFDGTHQEHRWTISSGRSGHRTPTGSFHIYSRDENHRSSLYGLCGRRHVTHGRSDCHRGETYVGADMHYYQQFTVADHSGVGFHRGSTSQSSHGCIHVDPGQVHELWTWARNGTPVIVCHDCTAILHAVTSARHPAGTGGTPAHHPRPHPRPSPHPTPHRASHDLPVS